MGSQSEQDKKIAANNKKAFHDFSILDRYEAGIVLRGNEVKSIREHKVNLKDSYARVKNSELFLYNMHISPYSKSRIEETDPLRPRKLLMHKSQIERLKGKLTDKSLTIVPTSIYLLNNRVKVEIALAKGKIKSDKRRDIKNREHKVEIGRALKNFKK